MNRAAEAAMPEAKALLVAAVKSMSVGDDSVTRFFADKTRARSASASCRSSSGTPRASTSQAASTRSRAKTANLGLLKGDDADIDRYVTKALDGLYFMIGEEERKIRRDPVGTGSALLAKVFDR